MPSVYLCCGAVRSPVRRFYVSVVCLYAWNIIGSQRHTEVRHIQGSTATRRPTTATSPGYKARQRRPGTSGGADQSQGAENPRSETNRTGAKLLESGFCKVVEVAIRVESRESRVGQKVGRVSESRSRSCFRVGGLFFIKSGHSESRSPYQSCSPESVPKVVAESGR